MAATYLTTNSIGAGPQFTYAADGDVLTVLSGVQIISTTSSALGGTGFNSLSLTVQGTVISTGASISLPGDNSFVQIGTNGSLGTSGTASGNAAINFSGSNGYILNQGTISAAQSIGVLSGGTTTIVNSGTISAADPVFLNLFGGAGDVLINSGHLIASSTIDAGSDARDNHGVVNTGTNAKITNLAGGTILATSNVGSGIAFVGFADGVVVNHGDITGVVLYGIDYSQSTSFVATSTLNFGTITGGTGSFNGADSNDGLTNRGTLVGDVKTHFGDDLVDNRNGTIEGDVSLDQGNDTYNGAGGTVTGTVFGGDGNDSFFGNATLAEVFDGGVGTDTLDFRFLGGVTLALDNSVASAGSAVGDTYFAFENVNGSNGGDDVIIGSNANNLINGFGGNDVLDGLKGIDILRGGLGVDVLTGGQGNDTFRFNNINEFGDTITDFSSTGANKDDRFQIAAGVGGGLVAGVLAANQFQSRADNVAQDADDRFVFRTTDKTLWFDADGNGSGAAIMVADLQANATMTNLDIVIF